MAEVGDVYKRFIATADRVVRRALETSSNEKIRRRAGEIRDLLGGVISELGAERSISKIEDAWGNLDPQVASLLLQELRLITAMHGEDSSDGSDDIATGKESLEDILGDWLPDWLKHLLKILNEILKLVK